MVQVRLSQNLKFESGATREISNSDEIFVIDLDLLTSCFPNSSLTPASNGETFNMAGDETLQKEHEDSGSEEEEDVAEIIPKVEIDPSKLTPLSPEVISKQVSQSYIFFLYLADTRSAGYDKLG